MPPPCGRAYDPRGLAAGPPVVALSDLVADGEPLGPEGMERLRTVLEHRAMGARLAELEAIVASQALSALRDTEAIRLDTLERLARAAEYRDDNSAEHTQRVAMLAARLARSMGQDDHGVRRDPAGRTAARPRQDRDPGFDPAQAGAA